MPFDPFVEAERLGRRQFSHPGARAFPTLQRSFMLASFQEQTYSDSMARLRQHVLLYWQRGFYKSSSIEMYARRCVPAVDMVSQKAYDPSEMTVLECLKFSAARLRGSFEGGKPVMPLIQRPTVLFVDELTNLLGGGEGFTEMVGLFNQVLERGVGAVSLIKMMNADLGDDIKKKLSDRGITFNQEEGIMQYPVMGSMWAACHTLAPPVYKALEQSGFLDRLAVQYWAPTESEFEEAWEFEPPIVPSEEFEALRTYNNTLWGAEWNKISSPPEPMLKAAKKVLKGLYDDYERRHRLTKMTGLRSARDGTNLRHLFTTHAMVDTIANDGKGPYEDVRYDLGCFDKVMASLPEYVMSRSPRIHHVAAMPQKLEVPST